MGVGRWAEEPYAAVTTRQREVINKSTSHGFATAGGTDRHTRGAYYNDRRIRVRREESELYRHKQVKEKRTRLLWSFP